MFDPKQSPHTYVTARRLADPHISLSEAVLCYLNEQYDFWRGPSIPIPSERAAADNFASQTRDEFARQAKLIEELRLENRDLLLDLLAAKHETLACLNRRGAIDTEMRDQLDDAIRDLATRLHAQRNR